MGPVAFSAFHIHPEFNLLIRTIHQSLVLYFCQIGDWGEDSESVVFCHRCKILDTIAVQKIPVEGNGPVGY